MTAREGAADMRAFKGTFRLLALIIRRERMGLLTAVALISLSTLGAAQVFDSMFSGMADRLMMAQMMRNPMMIAMFGPPFDMRAYSTGAMLSGEMLLLTMLAVSILSCFIVVRHTRADEERGRSEVLSSLPVGRLAQTLAALIYLLIYNGAIALITFAALGLYGMDVFGSMLYGASLGISGLFSAALAAVMAQLFSTARGANSASVFLTMALYLMRALGDIGRGAALSTISPLGLILRAQPYGHNLAWPLTAVLFEALALAVLALLLRARRDMDSAYLPERKSRAHAGKLLGTPLGLALRLTRGSIFAWLVGMFVMGLSYGSVMGDMDAFINGNAMLKQLLSFAVGYSADEIFIAMLISVLAMMAAIPALFTAKKLIDEERRGRVEPILARAANKPWLIGAYALIAAAQGALMLFASVSGFYLSAEVALGRLSYTKMLADAFMYLPAILAMLGLAVLLIGVKPSWFTAVWIYLGASFYVVYLGALLGLPEIFEKLTPFGLIPKRPIDADNPPLLIFLTVLSLLLAAAGIICYRRRDIA